MLTFLQFPFDPTTIFGGRRKIEIVSLVMRILNVFVNVFIRITTTFQWQERLGSAENEIFQILIFCEKCLEIK